MAEPVDVLLPQWGMGMTEGTVAAWHKEVGDHVEAGEAIAEIETAKAMQDLESPLAGTLEEIVAPVGEVVPVQGLLARVIPD